MDQFINGDTLLADSFHNRFLCRPSKGELASQAVAMQAGDFTGAINVYTEVGFHWIPLDVLPPRFGFVTIPTQGAAPWMVCIVVSHEHFLCRHVFFCVALAISIREVNM